jgi:ABC-type glycerol-3-phosphate transport system substrate-binding protein
MRIVKSALLCASLAAALTAAGCGARENGSAVTPASSASPAASASSTPAAPQELAVQAFYGNADVTALVQKEVKISYAKEEAKYLAALNALKKSPAPDAFSLCPNTSFTSAVINSGKLTVNLSLPDEDRLGSAGEGMLLDAFRKTLFQFKEVEAFEILVDGKKPESLMGHYELPSVFNR